MTTFYRSVSDLRAIAELFIGLSTKLENSQISKSSLKLLFFNSLRGRGGGGVDLQSLSIDFIFRPHFSHSCNPSAFSLDDSAAVLSNAHPTLIYEGESFPFLFPNDRLLLICLLRGAQLPLPVKVSSVVSLPALSTQAGRQNHRTGQRRAVPCLESDINLPRRLHHSKGDQNI